MEDVSVQIVSSMATFFLTEIGRFTDNGYLVAWSILEVNKQKTQFILQMVPNSDNLLWAEQLYVCHETALMFCL